MPKELTKKEKENAVADWIRYGYISEEEANKYDTQEQIYNSLNDGQIKSYQSKLKQQQDLQKDIDSMAVASLSDEQKRQRWIGMGMPYKDFAYTKKYLDALQYDEKAAAAIELKLRYDIAIWKLYKKPADEIIQLSDSDNEAVSEYEADEETYDQILADYEVNRAARVNNAPENSTPVNSAPENKVQEDPAPSVEEIDPEVAALEGVVTEDMKKQLDDVIAALDDGNMIFKSSSSEYGVMRSEDRKSVV